MLLAVLLRPPAVCIRELAKGSDTREPTNERIVAIYELSQSMVLHTVNRCKHLKKHRGCSANNLLFLLTSCSLGFLFVSTSILKSSLCRSSATGFFRSSMSRRRAGSPRRLQSSIIITPHQTCLILIAPAPLFFQVFFSVRVSSQEFICRDPRIRSFSRLILR